MNRGQGRLQPTMLHHNSIKEWIQNGMGSCLVEVYFQAHNATPCKSKRAFKHHPWPPSHQISGYILLRVVYQQQILSLSYRHSHTVTILSAVFSVGCLLPYTSFIHNHISPHTLHPCIPAAQKRNGLLSILLSLAVFLLFSCSALCTAMRGC